MVRFSNGLNKMAANLSKTIETSMNIALVLHINDNTTKRLVLYLVIRLSS